MKESIFSGKIKVGKCLLTNLVGKVPADLYCLSNGNWLKNYYYETIGEIVGERYIESMMSNSIPVGIDITSVQLKILISLLKILTKYSYKSNLEVRDDDSKLRLRVGLNEFVSEYGCDGVRGNTRKRILENLKDLSETKFFMILNESKESEEFYTYDNLFRYSFIKAMGRKFIIFDFHEVFDFRIKNYYNLLPDDFIQSIIALKTSKGKKNMNVSQHEIYMHFFLLSQISIRRQKIISILKKSRNSGRDGMIGIVKSSSIIRTNFLKLAFQLRMLNSIEKGFWSSIRQKIRQYLKRAESIGYIKKYSEDRKNDSVTIELNIDKVFAKKQ